MDDISILSPSGLWGLRLGFPPLRLVAVLNGTLFLLRVQLEERITPGDMGGDVSSWFSLGITKMLKIDVSSMVNKRLSLLLPLIINL